MKKPVYVIVAVDEKNGMGKAGVLPWHIPAELKFFQEVTTQTDDPAKKNVVIMGRKTWESIPLERRPLKGRKNIVVTRNEHYQAEGASVAGSLDEALRLADESNEKIFVIGGAEIVREAFRTIPLEGIYLTRIKGDFGCDVFLPEVPEDFNQKVSLGSSSESGFYYEKFLLGKILR